MNNPQEKMKSDDRILVLKPMDGKNPRSNTGLIDSRLFQGGNRLHAIRSNIDQLWYIRYDQGIVPPALKCKFTSFKALQAHVEPYFKNRNVEIEKVID